jgi:hypothetical protein
MRTSLQMLLMQIQINIFLSTIPFNLCWSRWVKLSSFQLNSLSPFPIYSLLASQWNSKKNLTLWLAWGVFKSHPCPGAPHKDIRNFLIAIKI